MLVMLLNPLRLFDQTTCFIAWLFGNSVIKELILSKIQTFNFYLPIYYFSSEFLRDLSTEFDNTNNSNSKSRKKSGSTEDREEKPGI